MGAETGARARHVVSVRPATHPDERESDVAGIRSDLPMALAAGDVAVVAAAATAVVLPDEGPTRLPTEEELLASGYTSRLPYQDGEPDCFVIACSDHRFRQATVEFLRDALGFHAPHMV